LLPAIPLGGIGAAVGEVGRLVVVDLPVPRVHVRHEAGKIARPGAVAKA
jgi:hypothetical protein